MKKMNIKQFIKNGTKFSRISSYGNKMKKIIIILFIVLGVILMMGFATFVYRRVSATHKQHDQQVAEGKQKLTKLLTLSADDIENIVIYDRYCE